jgi:hypothetical protein
MGVSAASLPKSFGENRGTLTAGSQSRQTSFHPRAMFLVTNGNLSGRDRGDIKVICRAFSVFEDKGLEAASRVWPTRMPGYFGEETVHGMSGTKGPARRVQVYTYR